MTFSEKIIKMYENKILVTSKDNNHHHELNIDINGTGQTITTLPASHDSHVHKVVAWNVEPFEGHTHTI